MAMIFGDIRENNGANPYLSSTIAENNKTNILLAKNMGGGNIKFEIKKLTVGDYCILVKNKENESKTIVAMVIERKTWKDLSASLKDERIIHQTSNLINIQKKKGCLILYIVEGSLSYKDDYNVANIPFKNLHAKLRHNLIRGVPYIQTKDEQHTAKIITDLARDILKLYKQGEIDFTIPKDLNTTQEILNEFDDLKNNETSKTNSEIMNQTELINHVEIKNSCELKSSQEELIDKNESKIINYNLLFQDYKNLAEKELLEKYCQTIHQINQVFKENFLKFNKKPNIIEEIERLTSNAEPENIIKYMDDDMLDDFELPAELKNQTPLEDSDIILNMWSNLPGMSNKSATLIMNNFAPHEILAPKKEEIPKLKQGICELKFSSGRRLGPDKARKFIELTYTGDDVIKKENLKELSIKLLSAIPGVTELSAKIILENWSLRDICQGYVQADLITELKGKNGRKIINNKVANKIIKIFKNPNEQ